jgi:V/A-type H+-transporting ATPase subunit F
MDIAVIGADEFLLGFRLAGIRKVFPVMEKNLQPKIEELMKDRTIGILVMDNDDMKKLPDHFRRVLVESVEPVVISIGRVEEVDLREKIKQAVGVDLWK